MVDLDISSIQRIQSSAAPYLFLELLLCNELLVILQCLHALWMVSPVVSHFAPH